MAVYLNGRLIGIARHNQDSVIVNFNYKEGDILKLSNGYGLNKANGIIKINSFLLQACGNISFNLNRYKFNLMFKSQSNDSDMVYTYLF